MVRRTALILLAVLQAGQYAQGAAPNKAGQDAETSDLKPQIVGGQDAGPRAKRPPLSSGSALRPTSGPTETGVQPRRSRSPLRPDLPPQQRADAGPRDPMTDESMRADARLADVCFVDPQHGWAVGDRGTIWHTDDGGRRWLLQEPGVGAPLRSVCFLTEQIGWAAGGFSHPYTHTSSGVLLWTRDGGRHWHREPKLLLPALAQVRFFNERQGWAVGCASAMFPAGIFVTQDGGQSWMPTCGTGTNGWLAGDFLDQRTGVVAGRGGLAAAMQYGELKPSQPGFGLRGLNRVKLVPPSYGWLIGDGGLVMMTADQGHTWGPPPGEPGRAAAPLSPGEGREKGNMASHFDFAALAVRGPKCWIAGSPGSRVFHTPDAGHTWITFSTGTTLPIRAMSFADDAHGWAVGDLGTILATADGGRTWQRQRAGGGRAALLAFFAQPEDIPLELLARHCGNDGYLGVVEVIGRRDAEAQPREEAHATDRAHEAVVAVGGSGAETAWCFPLCQPGLQLPAARIVETWAGYGGAGVPPAARGAGIVPAENGSREGRAPTVSNRDGCPPSAELKSFLVRQIRIWRPEVVVTHDVAPREDGALGPLVALAVQEAVQQAADPACASAEAALAGLAPWKVKRVYAVLPPETRGGSDLATAQLSPRLGRSLEDLAAQPRGLLADRFRAAPASIGIRLLSGQLAAGPAVRAAYVEPSETAAAGRGELFAGSALPAGGEARRAVGSAAAENLELLQRLAVRRRHTQAILDRFEQDPQAAVRLLAQTDELIRGLDPASAAQVLYRLGDRYHRTGRWDLAAETFQSLVERYPDDSLCRPAIRWLVQYYAAGETAGAVPANQRNEHLSRAVVLGQEIERTRPDLFADPAVRFPLAAAYRRLGQPRQADRLYLTDRRSMEHDAWWACAQGEVWIAQPKGPPPKPMLTCVKVSSRPKLDGRLDDAAWQQAKPVMLASPLHDDSEWPAAVMLAHDEQFLYIAISCRQAAGTKYPAATGARTRDSDLSGRDRVDIFLDVQRNYAAYYRLTIDHRGWAADSCFGDETWNPKWFIAAETADGTWTAEAAVPLSALAGAMSGRESATLGVASRAALEASNNNQGVADAADSASKTIWAIGIQRTLPSVGFQSWSTPASTLVMPEGFGYVVLE
jgi:photosystem II stability/assembly factor-like uncharacterized protein